MSLVVVACLALISGGLMAWLTRLAAQEQREQRLEVQDAIKGVIAETRASERAEREAFLAYLEREAQAAREERERLADRIQNPLGVAAAAWPVAEAEKATLEDADREWLEGPQSEVPFDPDLVLADVEVEG